MRCSHRLVSGNRLLSLVASALWLALAAPGWGCLNEYDRVPEEHEYPPPSTPATQLVERRRSADQYFLHLTHGDSQDQLSEEKVAQLAAAAETGDYRDRTNYAVALIRTGKANDAIEILKQVEADRPGEYVVATNLGTAYELAGDDEQALRWIRTGYELNPASHEGTEWLHVKILEAKLQLAQDQDWLKSHSVLGIDFGTQGPPRAPRQSVVDQLGNVKSLADVRHALEYQLHERVGLVSPPDQIVGALLFDLANLLALDEQFETSEKVLGLTVSYDANRSDAISGFDHYIKRRIADFTPSPSVVGLFVGGLISLAVLGLIVRWLRGMTHAIT